MVNLVRRGVVSLNRRDMVTLNRRRVVNFTGVCTEPTLSEEGDVFYNPRKHTHDSCITEVPSCQMFVLIIGGRFGGKFKDTEKSITNTEYLEAVKQKIPVFALVEAAVYSEHNVYNENLKLHGKEKADAVAYPSVDNVKVFEFIDDVRKNVINNAIVAFKDFSDIEAYLRKQWAGMMFSFIFDLSGEARVLDTLSELTKMSEKIEFLSKQILNSIGSDKAKLTIKLYDIMITHESFRDLTYFGIRPNPADILKAKDFVEIGKQFKIDIRLYKNAKEGDGFSISTDGSMSKGTFDKDINDFIAMKSDLTEVINESGSTVEEYLNS